MEHNKINGVNQYSIGESGFGTIPTKKECEQIDAAFRRWKQRHPGIKVKITKVK